MRLTRRLGGARGQGALSGAKLSVLGELYRQGERTPRQLARAARVHPQALTRTLASLEADALVSRRPDTRDRRSALIGLTSEGRDALAGDMAERDRWLEARLERLTPAERAVLALAAELMETLADED
jgi:DNA-binding MarR family transcriptional regulator